MGRAGSKMARWRKGIQKEREKYWGGKTEKDKPKGRKGEAGRKEGNQVCSEECWRSQGEAGSGHKSSEILNRM